MSSQRSLFRYLVRMSNSETNPIWKSCKYWSYVKHASISTTFRLNGKLLIKCNYVGRSAVIVIRTSQTLVYKHYELFEVGKYTYTSLCNVHSTSSPLPNISRVNSVKESKHFYHQTSARSQVRCPEMILLHLPPLLLLELQKRLYGYGVVDIIWIK